MKNTSNECNSNIQISTLFHVIKELWKHLSRKRKRQSFFLLILMFFSSFAEMASIGAIIPFLGVIASPEAVYQYEIIQPIIRALHVQNPQDLVLPITILFILIVTLSGAIRLILLYSMIKFSYATGADLSINIYRRTLYQDYSTHVSRNSSEVINGIIVKTNTVIGSILSPLIILISACIFFMGILIVLLLINPAILFVSLGIFGSFYWVIIKYTRLKIIKNSRDISEQSTQMIKALQEGLGGIRDVIIGGSQLFYCKIYRKADLTLRNASGSNRFISQSPRYMIEVLGMIIIALLAYVMTIQKNSEIIPVLGALALGSQKILPVLQQIYSSYSSIKGGESSFNDVSTLLNQPVPRYLKQALVNPIEFKNRVLFKDLSFRYTNNSPWILKDVELDVAKGECIGIVGKTGEGKSTFVDIIMGLLTPTKGGIFVDGKGVDHDNLSSWYNKISHVPQNIFLLDGTIEENIAFGIPKEEIDYERVLIAATQSKLNDFVNTLKDGYQAIIGERGVKLSGGQRQRIGIARALYREVEILILDEATSALDNNTEQLVMDSIMNLKKELTIFVIAHRLTTLRCCDRIIKVESAGVIFVKNYETLINDIEPIK